MGNKSDSEQREVSFERALEFAKQNGIHKCFETSAKTGNSVEEVFSCASKDIFAKNQREAVQESMARKGATPLSRNAKTSDFS